MQKSGAGVEKVAASLHKEKFHKLVQKLFKGSKLLHAWELKGGISAQVTALEIELPDGQTKKAIVRQHSERDFKRNPQIAADEFKLLQILNSVGMPTPKPYALEPAGETFPTPCIVIEFVEGHVESNPDDVTGFVRTLATNLAKIHKIDCSKLDLSFLPKQEEAYTEKLLKKPAHLDESLEEGRIRTALEKVWPLPQRNQDGLLHGDFWPGNTLWKEGQLLAVIDWEDAALGDPLADLANARLEILWAFGMEAMNDFTHQYQSMMPAMDFNNLAYWDLCAALQPASVLSEWGLEESTEKRMRERHKWFVTQAFENF